MNKYQTYVNRMECTRTHHENGSTIKFRFLREDRALTRCPKSILEAIKEKVRQEVKSNVNKGACYKLDFTLDGVYDVRDYDGENEEIVDLRHLFVDPSYGTMRHFNGKWNRLCKTLLSDIEETTSGSDATRDYSVAWIDSCVIRLWR